MLVPTSAPRSQVTIHQVVLLDIPTVLLSDEQGGVRFVSCSDFCKYYQKARTSLSSLSQLICITWWARILLSAVDGHFSCQHNSFENSFKTSLQAWIFHPPVAPVSSWLTTWLTDFVSLTKKTTFRVHCNQSTNASFPYSSIQTNDLKDYRANPTLTYTPGNSNGFIAIISQNLVC